MNGLGAHSGQHSACSPKNRPLANNIKTTQQRYTVPQAEADRRNVEEWLTWKAGRAREGRGGGTEKGLHPASEGTEAGDRE
jgi:hypothetical protein